MMKSNLDSKFNREHYPSEQNDPAFSRRIKLAELSGVGKTQFSIILSIQELTKLEKFLDVPKIVSLKCKMRLKPAENGWLLIGKLKIIVHQLCVISLERVRTKMEIPLRRHLLVSSYNSLKESTPLDLSLVDTHPLEDYLELGEIICEEIILALPQYPKKKGVTFAPHNISLESDKTPNHFQKLTKLKQAMEQESFNNKIK